MKMRSLCLTVLLILIMLFNNLQAQQLTRSQVASDLSQFRADLENRFSYFWYNQDTNGYAAALDSIQAMADAENGMSHNDFCKEISKVVSLFIDGHARVDFNHVPSGELPFRLLDAEGGVVALLGWHSGYYDPEYPYLTKIDGEDLDVWIERAKIFVAVSAPHRERFTAMNDALTYINMVRAESGLPISSSITLELKSLTGELKTVTINTGRRPSLGQWPESASRLLAEHNIGYLRLPTFSTGEGVTEINTWMHRFKNTTGLIIDLRDNNGGSRDALMAMMPYLMSESDTPHVANAGKYRLYKDFDYYHLANRFMYRENTPSKFGEAELQAIQDFKTAFTPEWDAPDDKFSEWHYLVINKAANPLATFFYNKPVIMLTNGHVFSAGDIFAGGLKGWRNVTLLGTPTGGGSARSYTETLSNSNVEVKLGSMISFQNNGLLYDLHGVDVDILLEPLPSDLIEGGTDTQVDSAIAFIHAQNLFVTARFQLNIQIVGNGVVTLDPEGGYYDSLSVATLSASPVAGWTFERWNGDLSGYSNPATILMNGTKNVCAIFSGGPGMIYGTGFESGSLDSAWTTKSSTPDGRIQITTEYGPHSGRYHLTMDTSVPTSNDVVNEAWLHLDLSGKTKVSLNFWWHDYKDGNDKNVDGIFFSDDGGVNFVQVLSLIDGKEVYEEITLDVDALAAVKGLNLTSEFIIKFQQAEDNPIPLNDGFGFDDIIVIDDNTSPVHETDGDSNSIADFKLFANYPNPFNPETVIKYQLPKDSNLRIVVYSLLGQEIAVLHDGFKTAGTHFIKWNGRDSSMNEVAAGVYIYKLEAGSFRQAHTMLLLK